MRILVLAIFWIWFMIKLYDTAIDFFFFDAFVLLFIAVTGLSFFAWCIYKDFREYKIYKNLASYIPTFTGLFFILTISALYLYQYNRTNAPTLIRAFYDGGYNGTWIDLKANGNYIITNGSGLGASYFYGTYSIEDSIITLDKPNIDNVITTDRLAVRTSAGFNNANNAYIIQVDNKGKEIESNFYFRVVDDYRSKQ